jgi:nicotinate phosphoribosyltransferase
MKAWEKEYGVDNGIFLTDCITTDCFLKDFNKKYATLFNGVRHDSGCPFEWGNKIISHYKKLGINPKTKTLLFSDSLDFAKADVIYNTFQDDINVAFGIGTYLSNDLGVVNPLNIVMKVMSVNGSPVAKISDTPGKTMCLDYEYVEYLKRCIDWRLKND